MREAVRRSGEAGRRRVEAYEARQRLADAANGTEGKDDQALEIPQAGSGSEAVEKFEEYRGAEDAELEGEVGLDEPEESAGPMIADEQMDPEGDDENMYAPTSPADSVRDETVGSLRVGAKSHKASSTKKTVSVAQKPGRCNLTRSPRSRGKARYGPATSPHLFTS